MRYIALRERELADDAPWRPNIRRGACADPKSSQVRKSAHITLQLPIGKWEPNGKGKLLFYKQRGTMGFRSPKMPADIVGDATPMVSPQRQQKPSPQHQKKTRQEAGSFALIDELHLFPKPPANLTNVAAGLFPIFTRFDQGVMRTTELAPSRGQQVPLAHGRLRHIASNSDHTSIDYYLHYARYKRTRF